MAVTIAHSKPAFCSACFAAKPDKDFLDFGAAYDGPAIVDAAGTLQYVSDLFICEDCVREAAQCLAIDPQPMRDLELELARAQKEILAWKGYAENLEETVGFRPAPVKRPPGRPKKNAERPEVKVA